MTDLIVRRLILMVPMLLGISIITFLIINAAPGDPVTLMLAESRAGGRVSQADLEAAKEKFGLNKPLPLRYFDWISQIVRGNFGRSLVTGRPVLELFLEKLPNTIKLSGLSLLLALAIGLPLGILSAVKQYSVLDHALTFFAFVGISVPTFWLGLMLIYVFAVWAAIFPIHGMFTVGLEGGLFASFWDSFMHYVLPVTAITLSRIAAYIRFQRSSLLEVIRQDYIRTARAKGLTERAVLLVHAWRNALLSIITLLGFTIVILVEGSIVIEFIYAWPGMGLLGITAVNNRDYNIIMAIVMLSAVGILLGNLLADILYALVDPRVRYAR